MVQPVKSVYVTAPFGRPGGWAAGYHTGIDYRAANGTPIYATKSGTVTGVGWYSWGPSYGLHVVIQSFHLGRSIRHGYAHLTRAAVYPGQKVKTGELIGYSGSTGNVTGPHLHYEERVSHYGYYNHIRPVLPDWKPVRKPRVSLRKVQPGKRNLHVLRVKRRLNRRFPNKKKLRLTRLFNPAMQKRYMLWQRRLGYRGASADGVPGKASLEKLGFKVRP